MKPLLPLLLCIAALCSFALAQSAAQPTITQAELVRRTQELVDAVASGDQGPWNKYFADDAMFFDEKGRTMGKPALIADITPLPPGFSGTIKVVEPQSRIEGDVAIFGYVMDETETVYGHEMHARYHATDTWLRRGGEYKIVASQAMRYYQDPAPGKVSANELKDYVGKYEMAPGKSVTVTAEGDKLFEQKGDRPKLELIPEAGPIFFRKGVEGRTLFERGVDGKVDKLIERRNDEDIVWKRVAEVKSSARQESPQLSKGPLSVDQLAVYKAFLEQDDEKLYVFKNTDPLLLGSTASPNRLSCLKGIQFPDAPQGHELGADFKALHRMKLVGEKFQGQDYSFSEIAFDSSGEYAIFKFGFSCGSNCSEGGFRTFKKTEGQWKKIANDCPDFTT